ncbi:MAG TPA: hypothetical protein PLI09_13225 [Candidatus Hydrogenedentes bacterium]|nr:hypothetical protein [Candidatus Hydrogenedentota bacterium]
MKRMLFGAIIVLVTAVGFGAGTVYAQPIGLPVVLVGDNVNLLQTLAPNEAANASAAYSVVNVLKVDEAKTTDGKPMSDLRGKAIHYLPTRAAEPAMTGNGFSGKKVRITGKLFKNEATILVEKVEEAPPAATPVQPAAIPENSGIKPAKPSNDNKDEFKDVQMEGPSGLQVL